MEATFAIEKELTTIQEKIVELERRDEQIYTEMIELDNDEHDQLALLVDEGLQLVDERDVLLHKERDKINSSEEQFEHIKLLIDKIENEEEKHYALQMYDAMVDRYKAYDEVFDSYTDALYRTQSLYKKLLEEGEQSVVVKTIQEVNDSYERTLLSLDSFNDRTNEYNQMKNEYFSFVREK